MLYIPDGNLIDQYSFSSGPSSCPTENSYSHQTSLQSAIWINENVQSILHGDNISFGLGSAYSDPCSTPWAPVSDQVKMDIVDGQQYGNFYHNDGSMIGPTYTALLSDISTLGCYFKADGKQPCGATANISVTASVPSAGISSQVSFQVFCNLQPINYQQNQKDWGGKYYDGTNYLISKRGCALTSLAMALTAFGVSINPGSLNDYLNTKHGFTGTGDVIWPKAQGLSNYVKITKSLNKSVGGENNSSSGVIDNALGNCKLIIVEVLNPTSGDQHWVLVTQKDQNGDYIIVDPAYLDRTRLINSVYAGKFWEYVTVGPCK